MGDIIINNDNNEWNIAYIKKNMFSSLLFVYDAQKKLSFSLSPPPKYTNIQYTVGFIFRFSLTDPKKKRQKIVWVR